MILLPTAALAPLLILAAQPAGTPAGPPWTGKMLCTVNWTDPAVSNRKWTLGVASDSSTMTLAIYDRAQPGDPKPLARDETRELAPRKAKIEVTGIGASAVEVTSFAIGEDRIWHDVPLGHVENLDKFPAAFVLTLAIENAAPMRVEMRDFGDARVYLKRCLDR